MHRYEELEKLYYKKLYIKYFIYFLIFILIIFISSFTYFTLNKTNTKIIKKTKTINTQKTKPQSIKKSEIKKTIKQPQKVKKIIKKLTLYPIYPDIELITKKNNKFKEINKTKDIKKLETIKSKSKPKITENKTDKKSQSKKTPEIKIIIKTETIQDLINFYNINPEFNNGMKIAQYYFKHKKYEESIKWCKKINKIEPENYESWYLFAKNLIQLNKNKEAKKVLIYYLSSYGPNDKIEKLLRSIK